jgi:hypothetical protein
MAQVPRCNCRVRVLYGGKRHLFRCRKCYGLAYRSTRLSGLDRADTNANKLALKICGGDRELYDGETFPEKPKRMRWAKAGLLWAMGPMNSRGGSMAFSLTKTQSRSLRQPTAPNLVRRISEALACNV